MSPWWTGVAAVLGTVFLLAGCQTNTNETQQTQPELPQDELAIEDAWAEPASRGDSTRLYLTLANGRSEADTLLGARAPIFSGAQFYTLGSDTSQVQPGSTLVAPAGTRMTLAPDGPHIVLRGLTQSLPEGETLLVTLDFAQSGLQQVRAPIQSGRETNQQ